MVPKHKLSKIYGLVPDIKFLKTKVLVMGFGLICNILISVVSFQQVWCHKKGITEQIVVLGFNSQLKHLFLSYTRNWL